MSTRSYICKENEDGTYTGIYCHSDGYLTYNGAMLIDHYASKERVDKLLQGGDLSSLGSKIEPDPNQPHGFDFSERQEDVCVYYGRDRGETGIEARMVRLEDIEAPDSWIEYCYVFGKDGVWRYFECGKLKNGLKTVQEGLDEEYKDLGFSRPPDTYGYYSPDEIEKRQAEERARQMSEMG